MFVCARITTLIILSCTSVKVLAVWQVSVFMTQELGTSQTVKTENHSPFKKNLNLVLHIFPPKKKSKPFFFSSLSQNDNHQKLLIENLDSELKVLSSLRNNRIHFYSNMLFVLIREQKRVTFILEGVLNFNCTLVVFCCNILVIFKNLERCPGCESLALTHGTIKAFSSPLKARQKYLLPLPLFWPFFLFSEVGFFSSCVYDWQLCVKVGMEVGQGAISLQSCFEPLERKFLLPTNFL